MTKQLDIDLKEMNTLRVEAAEKLFSLLNEHAPETSFDDRVRFADSMSRVLVLAGLAVRNTNEILAEKGSMLNESGIKLCLEEAINLDAEREKSIFKKRV